MTERIKMKKIKGRVSQALHGLIRSVVEQVKIAGEYFAD